MPHRIPDATPPPSDLPPQDIDKTSSIWNSKLVYVLSALAFAGLAGTGIGFLATATYHVAVGISLLAAGVLGEGFVIAKWRNRTVTVMPSHRTTEVVQNVAASTFIQAPKTQKDKRAQEEKSEAPAPAKITVEAKAQEPPPAIVPTPATVSSAAPQASSPQDKKDAAGAASAPSATQLASQQAQKSNSDQPPINATTSDATQQKEQDAARSAEQTGKSSPIASAAASAPPQIEAPKATFNRAGIMKSFLRSDKERDQIFKMEDLLNQRLEVLWSSYSPQARKEWKDFDSWKADVLMVFHARTGVRFDYDAVAVDLKGRYKDDFWLKKGVKVVVILNNGEPMEAPHPMHHTAWMDLLNELEVTGKMDSFYGPRCIEPGGHNDAWSEETCYEIARRILPAQDLRIYQPGRRKFSMQEEEILKLVLGATSNEGHEVPTLIIPSIVPGRNYGAEDIFRTQIYPTIKKEKGNIVILLFYNPQRDGLTAQEAQLRYGNELLQLQVQACPGENRMFSVVCLNDSSPQSQSISAAKDDSDKSTIDVLRLRNIKRDLSLSPYMKNILSDNYNKHVFEFISKFLESNPQKKTINIKLRAYQEGAMFTAQEVETLQKMIWRKGLKETKEVPAMIVRSGMTVLPEDQNSLQTVFNEHVIFHLKKEKGNVAILLFYPPQQYANAGVEDPRGAQQKYIQSCFQHLGSSGIRLPGRDITVVFFNGRVPDQSMDGVLNDATNKQWFEMVHNWYQSRPH